MKKNQWIKDMNLPTDYDEFGREKPTHTPTPFSYRRKPLNNIASGEKDKFQIMRGDDVIASIARSWEAVPTAEDLSCGAQPVARRSAEQAEDLATFIVRAVNSYQLMLDTLKDALFVIQGQSAIGNYLDSSERDMSLVEGAIAQAIAQAEGK